MPVTFNSDTGKYEAKSGFKSALDFGKDMFQSVARDTFNIGIDVSKGMKKLDDRLTGGIFDFPTELRFEDEDTTVGKIQRTIFGDDKDELSGIADDYEEVGNLLQKAYNLDEKSSRALGTGIGVLFATTNFLPAKKTLVKTLLKTSNTDDVARMLIKEGIDRDIVSGYAPLLAKANKVKDVNRILEQIDNISRNTTLGERASAIAVPPKTKLGKISISATQQTARTVQNLLSMERKIGKKATNILLREKEQILKEGFKSTLQKQQDTFLEKITKTIDDYKQKEVNIQEIKNNLLQIANDYFPEGTIRKNIVKKIVNAKTETGIKDTILSISKQKDKSIRTDLISSIKNVIENSENLTVAQRGKLAATIKDIRVSGMTPATQKRLQKMEQYFSEHPEKELLLGKEASNLLLRAKDLAKFDLLKLDTKTLRELERRVSYIKEKSNLEEKFRKDTKKLQIESLSDSLARDVQVKDIPGKINSLGRELTTKERINNFWASFRENMRRNSWNFLSADNFFDELGETASKIYKDQIDKAANMAKRGFATVADRVLSEEARLFKKYGERLKNHNYERIMIHALREQKGGMAKMLKSDISKDLIDSIVLSPQEMEWYQFARKELDELFPKIDEVLVKTSGGKKQLGHIDNYFPMIVDFTKSEELGEQLFKDSMQNMRGTSKGFTKNRKLPGMKDATYNMNARDVLLNYARRSSDFINMEETIRDLQTLTNTPKVRSSLGKDATHFINEWLDTLSRGGISKNYKRSFVEDIRDAVGSAVLGFRLSPIIKQPIAKLTAGSLLGPDHLFKHDVEFISNKLNSLVDEASTQQRFRSFDDPSFDVAGLNKYQQMGYAGIKYLDKLTSNNVWYSAYKKYFADNKIPFSLDDFTSKKFNKDAVDFADKLVRKTQGTGEIKDMPQIFRADNRGFWKSLFQFQSFVLNQAQLLPVDMKRAIMKEKDPQKALNIASFFVLAGLAESYVSAGLTQVFGSQKQKEYQEMSPEERLADSFMGQIPLINNAISIAKFGGTGIPVLDSSTDIVKGGYSLFTSKKDETKLKGGIQALGGATSILGIPGSGQLEQILRNSIKETEKKEPMKLKGGGTEKVRRSTL